MSDPATSLFALTAVGTVRGRVSRRELCLGPVGAELGSILGEQAVLRDAPFTLISVTIHLGDEHHPPVVRRLARSVSELEVAVGIPFADVRRREPEQICRVIRRAAVQALIAGCERHGLPTSALAAALARDQPGSGDASNSR